MFKIKRMDPSTTRSMRMGSNCSSSSSSFVNTPRPVWMAVQEAAEGKKLSESPANSQHLNIQRRDTVHAWPLRMLSQRVQQNVCETNYIFSAIFITWRGHVEDVCRFCCITNVPFLLLFALDQARLLGCISKATAPPASTRGISPLRISC